MSRHFKTVTYCQECKYAVPFGKTMICYAQVQKAMAHEGNQFPAASRWLNAKEVEKKFYCAIGVKK